jgi:2-polyprenyl-6-methoxyphenol hydroxylase-like FAD-dependent oxidoreductase
MEVERTAENAGSYLFLRPAHATSPSLGQGASLAIESAVQLARCLRDLPNQEGRVERIIAAAARTSAAKVAGPFARILRDWFMPIAMRAMTKFGALAKQFEYRIDWADPVASPG